MGLFASKSGGGNRDADAGFRRQRIVKLTSQLFDDGIGQKSCRPTSAPVCCSSCYCPHYALLDSTEISTQLLKTTAKTNSKNQFTSTYSSCFRNCRHFDACVSSDGTMTSSYHVINEKDDGARCYNWIRRHVTSSRQPQDCDDCDRRRLHRESHAQLRARTQMAKCQSLQVNGPATQRPEFDARYLADLVRDNMQANGVCVALPAYARERCSSRQRWRHLRRRDSSASSSSSSDISTAVASPLRQCREKTGVENSSTHHWYRHRHRSQLERRAKQRVEQWLQQDCNQTFVAPSGCVHLKHHCNHWNWMQITVDDCSY